MRASGPLLGPGHVRERLLPVRAGALPRAPIETGRVLLPIRRGRPTWAAVSLGRLGLALGDASTARVSAVAPFGTNGLHRGLAGQATPSLRLLTSRGFARLLGQLAPPGLVGPFALARAAVSRALLRGDVAARSGMLGGTAVLRSTVAWNSPEPRFLCAWLGGERFEIRGEAVDARAGASASWAAISRAASSRAAASGALGFFTRRCFCRAAAARFRLPHASAAFRAFFARRCLRARASRACLMRARSRSSSALSLPSVPEAQESRPFSSGLRVSESPLRVLRPRRRSLMQNRHANAVSPQIASYLSGLKPAGLLHARAHASLPPIAAS